ncbi:MAG: SRPBCC family protein [Acidobacteriota bacterium]
MLGVGALSMYYLDPDRGKRRRVALTDQANHCGKESRKFANRFRRDLQHRAEGAIAEAKTLLRRDEVSDGTLHERIRSILGRKVPNPDAIEVKVKQGHVELMGKVLARDVGRIRRAVACVRGVRDISVFLETVEGPESQGRRKAPAEIAGFFGDKWSPTARVAVGGAGLALMVDGFRRHHSAASKAALAGSLMLARSVLNMPLRRIPRSGIHVEKTLHVHAGRETLFTFWSNPENYAKVFSHVKEIHAEGADVYRWHLSGPAGVPLSWVGKITKLVPNQRVEWRSLPGSIVENHGVIRLDEEADGYTRVHVQMEYAPPAGLLGHGFATLLGLDPRNLMHHDLVQLQSVLERGFTTAHKHRVTASDLGPVPSVGTAA